MKDFFNKNKKMVIVCWSIAAVALIATIVILCLNPKPAESDSDTFLVILTAITAITAVTLIIYPLLKAFDAKMKAEDKKKKEDPQTILDNEFARVKILGTRTGEQTKLFSTENFTVYSFLVEYKSGRREVIECTQEDKQFKYLIGCADIDEK